MADTTKLALRRRLAAVTAILLLAVVLAMSTTSVVDDFRRFTVHGPLLLVTVFSAWYAITRTGGRRVAGSVVAVASVVALLGAASLEDGSVRAWALLRIGLVCVAIVLARFALALDVRSAKRMPTAGRPVGPAQRPVLLINPRSGGGKAERWDLPEACRQRGIEPIVLAPGEDLRRLAERAVDAGADVIGMAGGDGSQAVVATVARDRGVPMVVVPAGTRNHLARDLGLDRSDLVGALDAFDEAVERPLDLAEVNGRVFVNNVSMGVYASIVATPAYRDAKVETTLAAIPEVMGPRCQSFPLSFVGPAGDRRDAAHLVQVSNNPYRRSLQGLGSRPRLDTGRLGVVALEVNGNSAASAFLTAVMAGRPERFSGFDAWTAERFEVTSTAPISVGLDGESMVMDPPLRFVMRAHAVRVRLPKHAIGAAPSARALDWRSAPRALWRTALGRPVEAVS